MAESRVIINRPKSSSPPPNCAICLGSCTNKSYSDSCMHQFCFKCLLEWSKIKAECPLCKQAFKSILHNVKPNGEHDEHIVETTPRNEDIHLIDNDEFLFLPLPNAFGANPMRHHQFQFRTTFTVDSRGEHAVEQMLLSHPLTASGRIHFTGSYPGRSISTPLGRRDRIDYGATSFRRSIYARNLWVNSLPDVTGHYRDVSPSFFRENPAARTRLAPWLNRELNALLFENTALVLRLTNIIMDNLLRHHICSRSYRSILNEYLGTKTDHFVHEFYNFMRSPFDMIGYDRHTVYTERPLSPFPYVHVSDPDDDSDVIIVSSSQPNEPVVIDLINSDSDEPIIVSGDAQIPMPILPSSNRESPPLHVNLPPKLAFKKNKALLQEKEKWRRTRRKRRHRSTSSSSDSSSDERERDSYRKYKKKRILKRLKVSKHEPNFDDTTESGSDVNVMNDPDDDDDNKPLIDILRKKWKHKENRDRHRSKSEKHSKTSLSRKDRRLHLPIIEPLPELPGCSTAPYTISSPAQCSMMQIPGEGNSTTRINYNDIPSCSGFQSANSTTSSTVVNDGSMHKYLSEVDSGAETEVNYGINYTVKSEIRPKANSILLRKQNNKWYNCGGLNNLYGSDTDTEN